MAFLVNCSIKLKDFLWNFVILHQGLRFAFFFFLSLSLSLSPPLHMCSDWWMQLFSLPLDMSIAYSYSLFFFLGINIAYNHWIQCKCCFLVRLTLGCIILSTLRFLRIQVFSSFFPQCCIFILLLGSTFSKYTLRF